VSSAVISSASLDIVIARALSLDRHLEVLADPARTSLSAIFLFRARFVHNSSLSLLWTTRNAS
jgi:hypothetical protein